MVVRMLALATTFAGVCAIARWSPMLGFSIATFAAAFAVALRCGVAPNADRLTRTFALVSAFGRALAAAAAALLALAAAGVFADQGYAAQAARDARWTAAFLVVLTPLAAILAMTLARAATASPRALDWSHARLVVVFGLAFSCAAQMVKIATADGPAPAFAAPSAAMVAAVVAPTPPLSMDTCRAMAVSDPDAEDGVTRVRKPTHPWIEDAWATGRCGARLTPRLCETLRTGEGSFHRFKRAAWRYHGCHRIETLSLDQLLAVVAMAEGVVDGRVEAAANAIASAEGWPRAALRFAISVLFSMKLALGLVIATYASLIVWAFAPQRPHAASD